MSQKPAYIKPIHTLVASSTRVPEQIKGRLVFVHTEKLRSGSEKAIAVMVDKHMEFWEPGKGPQRGGGSENAFPEKGEGAGGLLFSG